MTSLRDRSPIISSLGEGAAKLSGWQALNGSLYHMPSHKPHLDFVELHILHHASEGSLYGLWMIEELAEHGYKLNASQIYPRFHRLERQGCLKRTDKVVDGKLRKYYRITHAGRAYLREQKRRLMELISEALTVEELSGALDRRRKREEAKRRLA